MELETTGYFGLVSLSTDPRWRSHSIYLFGVDMYGNTLFTGNPYNWGMGINPSELTTIAVRDDVAVAEAFGETFLYYSSFNPSNGMPQRKVSFVKRVLAFGVPILIGAGYYLDDSLEIEALKNSVVTALAMIPSYNIEDQAWFRAPLAADTGIWTAPYFDAGGGEIWMITLAVPARNAEGIFAIVTTDLPVDASRPVTPRVPGATAVLTQQLGTPVIATQHCRS